MTWQVVKFETDSEDRSVRAFVWVLVIGCGLWGAAIIAAVIWGVTR